MLNATDDLRIDNLRPLIPPAILMEELPLSQVAEATVTKARKECQDSIHLRDDRLVVIVGPCSIHDEKAALEYAERLKVEQERLSDDLIIIMRVYFEKPRTTVGWKGLINDPDLNGQFNINKGLRTARRLLLNINDMGLAAGSEFLDTISPQFIADLISWGAIGARTTESQIHRELASGLSAPIGFKNATTGDTQIAFDAIKAASNPHHFLSVTKQGLSAIVSTKGNPDCHLILRGGSKGPNFDAKNVAAAEKAMANNGLNPAVMIDCSHGNSKKDPTKQPEVAENIAQQIETGNKQLFGVMIESHLVEGRQDLSDTMCYGQSITDGCLGWDNTVSCLERLAQAVQARRKT